MNQVTVIVPATTANMGVGFDCLGAALSMYNEFRFTVVENTSELTIVVTGDEATKVRNDRSNLVYQSFLKVYEKINRLPPGVKIEIKLGVPFARGLGSSATAIVGGLVGANELAGKPLTETAIRDLAIAIEGHPDNVVPAYIGNCCLSIKEAENWQICQIPWHSELIPVVAIPDFELSTAAARRVLPTTISRSDAIFNISRMGLLLRGLETNNGAWLATALEDKIHQPYRKALITGYDAVKAAAIAAGAWGMVISGAGATLLALTNAPNQTQVVTAMEQAWQKKGVKAKVKALTLDTQGTRVIYN
jgi:homoserine kinase